MSGESIALMIFSMVALWGSLVFAIIHLLRSDTGAHEPTREETLHHLGQERDL